jgi:hypothetical protein
MPAQALRNPDELWVVFSLWRDATREATRLSVKRDESSELRSHVHVENTTLLMHPPCHLPLQHSKKGVVRLVARSIADCAELYVPGARNVARTCVTPVRK